MTSKIKYKVMLTLTIQFFFSFQAREAIEMLSLISAITLIAVFTAELVACEF